MPQYYFPAPLAEEFTGTPDTTDIISIYKVTGAAHAPYWQAQDSRGFVKAEWTPPAPLREDLPETERRNLLVAWAQAYERSDLVETPPTGQPAWVFVHLHSVTAPGNPFYMYAAVRPKAGQAFEHILRYASYGRPQDWDWLFRDLEDGEEHKRGERPLQPELARLPERDLDAESKTALPDGSSMTVLASWPNGYRCYEKQTGNERYEWPDGSAITVQGQVAWDFGFYRDRLADQAVIEACGDDVAPMFAWPGEVAVAGELT